MLKRNRMAAGVLVLVMLMTLIPTGVVFGAESSDYEFRYKIYCEAAHVDQGGKTNGKIEGWVYFYDEKEKAHEASMTTGAMKDKGQKKEANGLTEATSKPPWMVSGYEVQVNDKDDYKVHWLKLYVHIYKKGSTKDSEPLRTKQIGSTYYPGGKDPEHKTGKWIGSDKSRRNIFVSVTDGNGPQTVNPSKITGWDKFDDSMYLNVDGSGASGSETLNVSGGVSGNRWNSFFSKSGIGYNMWDWQGTPTMKITASGTGGDDTDVTWKSLGNAVSHVKRGDYVTGYTINKSAMLDYMNKHNINQIDIRTELDFPWHAFSDSQLEDYGKKGESADSFVKTYRIYRKAFAIKNITYTRPNGTRPYWRSENNRYYNTGEDGIRVVLQLFTSANDGEICDIYNHFKGGSYFKGKTLKFDSAQVKLGNDGPMIDSSAKSASIAADGKVELFFPLKQGLTSNNVNVKLFMKGVHFMAGEQKYTLIDDSRTKDYDLQILSKEYKVDTIRPTIQAEIDPTYGKEVNGWRKEAKVTYQVSEELYGSLNQATMLYKFTDGKKNYPITQRTGQGKVFEAVTSASPTSPSYLLVGNAPAPNDGADTGEREVEGSLVVVDSCDVAGNTAVGLKIADLKLDNLAPRVEAVGTMTEKASDGSKSVIYNFYVWDASKSARVYYAFTEGENSTPPAFEPDKVETSGEMNTTIGQWAFVEQNPAEDSKADTKDATNGSAAIKVELNESFVGNIHYFAEDALGNRTNQKTLSDPADVNKNDDMITKSVVLKNPDTSCDITVLNQSMERPLSNYDISITTKGSPKVQWRWEHPSEKGYIAGYRDYTSGTEVGSGTQLDDNGNQVILDGECTLYVQVTADGAPPDTYTKNVVFDNNVPTIDFSNLSQGTFRENQSIGVEARDADGIETAIAKIIRADGTAVPERQEFNIPVAAGIVDQSVAVMSAGNAEDGTDTLPAGAYKLQVTVKDYNGFETTKESNEFYLRNKPVETVVSIVSDKEFDGVPLLPQNEYTMKIQAKEAFLSATAGIPQHLYYSISDSPSDYGAWMDAGVMSVGADKNSYEIYATVPTPTQQAEGMNVPYALAEGRNTIYVHTMIAPEGVEPIHLVGSGIVAQDTEGVEVILDTQVPKVELNLEDTHTNTTIDGQLRLTDDQGGAVILNKNGISEDVLTVVETEEAGIYDLTVKGNINQVMYAVDEAGHKTEIPIQIAGFDFEAPVVTNEAPTLVENGARKDAIATIIISDALKGYERFALIPQAEIANAKNADGTIKEEYFIETETRIEEEGEDSVTEEEPTDSAVPDTEEEFSPFTTRLISEVPAAVENEMNLTYEASLRGITGSYYVGVRAVDALGNTKDTLLDSCLLTAEDVKPEIQNVIVSPSVADKKAKVTVQFNVPVSVLSQSLIANQAPAPVEEEDEQWTADEYNFENAVNYASSYVTDYSFIIDHTGKYPLYTTDELDRTELFEVDITDDMVSFGNTTAIEAKTVLLRGATDQDDNAVFYREIIGDEMIAGRYMNESETSYLLPAVEVSASSNTALLPAQEKYDDPRYDWDLPVYVWDDREGLRFSEAVSAQYLLDPSDPSQGYSKLVYWVGTATDGEEDLDHNVRNVAVLYKADVDTEWTDYVATTGNIDNTPPISQLTYSPTPVYDEEHNPTSYTLGNVKVEGTLFDPHTGLAGIGIDAATLDYGEDFQTYIEINENTVYPIVVENELFRLEIKGDKDIRGVKVVNLEIFKNIYINMTPINTVGNFGMMNIGSEGIWIDYINKEDIDENDYSLSYFYEDHSGAWQPITEGVY